MVFEEPVKRAEVIENKAGRKTPISSSNKRKFIKPGTLDPNWGSAVPGLFSFSGLGRDEGAS
ncbi:hypothetical protein J2Z47_002243 [Cohnella thailandensis]|nr:hypothetical protein [Cohnella thailandensis]